MGTVIWKKISKIKVPPKVRNFMWRVCVGCLLTIVNLRSKYVLLEPWCTGCHREHENEVHVLFQCPMAVDSRALSGIHVDDPNSDCIWDWFHLYLLKNH